MKVLFLGSNEKKNAGKKQGQDWSKICWKEVDGILRNGYLTS